MQTQPRDHVRIADGARYAPTSVVKEEDRVVAPGEFQFAAAYLDHGHIYGQAGGLVEAGGTLTRVYDPDRTRLEAFCARFPQAKPADSFEAILADPNVQLVAAAAVPSERADIGIRVMRADKDYFTDKSPFTTLAQLQRARAVAQETRRKYMVYYSERLHNEAAWHAGELIMQGAVGRVLHVLITAPHRLSADSRPSWFFEKEKYGGILTDIGSHQVEQFLTYAGVADASVAFARVANLGHPAYPGLEDFGEFALVADSGAGCYARLDWFTPDGLPVWGDGRTMIVGTDGTMEVRKYTDIARQTPASKIFLSNGTVTTEIDCTGKIGYPYFGLLIRDVMHRTERAMTQDHAFLAAELSMRAQALADRGRDRQAPSIGRTH